MYYLQERMNLCVALQIVGYMYNKVMESLVWTMERSHR